MRLSAPGLVAAAGFGLLVLAWLLPLPLPEASAPPPSPSADPLVLPTVPPLDDLSATLARPLFSPTRRPLPEGVAEPPPGTAAAVLNRYRLQGVVIDGSRRRVLLVPAPGGKTLSVGEGDSVDGWTIDRIAPERLTLRSGERVETVELGAMRHR